MRDAVYEFLMQILRDSAAQLAGIVIVLLAIGVPIALAFYLLMRRMASRHGVNVSFDWQSNDGSPGPARTQPRRKEVPPSDTFDPRRFLVMVYKILMLMAAMALLAGTVLAYWVATPGNGLLLVAMILGALSLMAFLSIGKHDGYERHASEWRGVWEEFADKINVVTSHADPDVHVMDNETLATARRMAADGASLDDICGAVERNYAGWDEPRREAFRRVMQAVLDSR